MAYRRPTVGDLEKVRDKLDEATLSQLAAEAKCRAQAEKIEDLRCRMARRFLWGMLAGLLAACAAVGTGWLAGELLF